MNRSSPWRLALFLVALGTPTGTTQAQVRVTPLPDKLSSSTRTAIERLTDSLVSERLPANALRDKAAEGALKGASDAQILSAVRALANRLRDARAAMGASSTDDELLAGASALYAGVAPDALERFAAAQRRRNSSVSLTVPLAVVAHLASSNVPGTLALASVESLMSRGARDVDFGAFRAFVERDLMSGRTASEALDAGVRSTLRGIERKR